MYLHDEYGRIVITTDAPTEASTMRGGMAFREDGALHVIERTSTEPPFRYAGGRAVTDLGQLVVITSGGGGGG